MGEQFRAVCAAKAQVGLWYVVEGIWNSSSKVVLTEKKNTCNLKVESYVLFSRNFQDFKPRRWGLK